MADTDFLASALGDPKVRATALRLARHLGSRDPEDVVQEAAERALRYRGTLRSGAPIEPWLMRIVSRVAIDAHRRVETIPVDDTSHFDRAARPDFFQTYALHDAVATLPESQRRLVVLHDFYGFKTHEIASDDGVNHSTVKTRLRRARLALRSALTEQVA